MGGVQFFFRLRHQSNSVEGRKEGGWSLSFGFDELLQASDTLLLIFAFADPELVTIFHDVCQDAATEEDHVFLLGRVFDFDFEFLEKWK